MNGAPGLRVRSPVSSSSRVLGLPPSKWIIPAASSGSTLAISPRSYASSKSWLRFVISSLVGGAISAGGAGLSTRAAGAGDGQGAG